MKTHIIKTLALFFFIHISINSQKKDVEVTIELSKTTYNVFESIDGIIRYINNGEYKDSIGTQFLSNYCNCFNCKITDENGKLFKETYYSPEEYGISPPRYILNPNDTLIEYTDLLYWGQETKNKDSVFLVHSRYYPPGRYTGYFYWDHDPVFDIKPPLKTNIFKFEVVDNTPEDMKVLELCRAKKYDEVIETFPDNVFTEDAFREKIRKALGDVYDNKLSADSLFSLRFGYMMKFPNSFNSITYVGQYLSHIVNGKFDMLEEKIDEFKDIFKESFIGKYLNNRFMLNIIKNLIINNKFAEF